MDDSAIHYGLGGRKCKDVQDFFKVLFQSIILFGSDTWVVAPRLLRSLIIFHNRVSLWIHFKKNWWQSDYTWVYPTIREVPEEAGLWPRSDYIPLI